MPKAMPLLQLVQTFVEKDPIAVARRLESMELRDASSVVRALPLRSVAQILPHLQVSFAAGVLAGLDPAGFEGITRKLEPERTAAIFVQLPEDARERFAPHVPQAVQRHVRSFAAYPEDSVGQVMTSQYLLFGEHITAREVIKRLRASMKRGSPASYAYVVAGEDVLAGVINMHDLLLADPDVPLSSIMRRDVFALRPFMTLQAAAHELGKRRYFAAPVVDGEGRILGVVKAERLLSSGSREIGQDLQKMFGAGGDESAFSPIRYSLRKRSPWLGVNLATAFLAAAVVALFEDTIARFTVLAIFLPVVAGQGGNAGAQSLAIVMRGLVMREIPRSRFVRLVLKEGWLGIINGAATGALTAIVAWIWFGNPVLGLVVALGMLVNLLFAGLAGATIPIGLKSFGLDPAQSSSIILTTVTDVVGFFAFLGFAVVFQQYLG